MHHGAFSLALRRSGIHKSTWKDGLSGKTGGFCEHKLSFLYNQDVEVVTVCQQAAMMCDIDT